MDAQEDGTNPSDTPNDEPGVALSQAHDHYVGWDLLERLRDAHLRAGSNLQRCRFRTGVPDIMRKDVLDDPPQGRCGAGLLLRARHVTQQVRDSFVGAYLCQL